jgi:hypothetical protein
MNKSRFINRKKQAGEGIISLLLGFVVIAIIAGALYAKFGKASTSAQGNDLVADLTTLTANIKTNYAGNYGSITNAKLSGAGFFKDLNSFTDSSGTVTVGLGGGTLTVSPGKVNATNDSAQYVITQIPDAACITLATSLGKSATILKFGTSAVKDVGTAFNANNITCSGDNNTVTMVVL